MRSLTAVVHTQNDVLRLGRCLETAYPCDDILVIDHGSTDGTVHVAREFGARVVPRATQTEAVDGIALRQLVSTLISPRWAIYLDPRESLSEALAASLFEWKLNGSAGENGAYALLLREERQHGWIDNPAPQTRLVSAGWSHWNGRLPASREFHPTLDGRLLRFEFP